MNDFLTQAIAMKALKNGGSGGAVGGNVAKESTSQEILEMCKIIRTMVTDVQKFDWKNFWANMATGELFSTKFYNYEKSTNPAGEKLNASKGLVAVPSTDKVKNQDDFAGRNAFNFIDCNFIVNDSSEKIPVAIKGGNGFHNTGKVDVAIMTPPTYWGKEEFDGYYIIHFSDTPHPEVGCTIPTPWTDENLGYGMVTKYYAGLIDGIAYSSSGNAIYNFVSAQLANTELKKKGAGYVGSGSERTAYLLCMLWIKYATKNSQKFFRGHVDTGSHQYKVVEAGENVNYVVITTTQASNFYVGETVSIGVPGTDDNKDRGQTTMNSIAKNVRITAIEAIADTANSKVYVEKTGMTITETTYISSMPLHSGTTDEVLGTDGYLANDGKHAFKLGGIEDGVGAYFISMNELWNKTTASMVDYYIRPKGVAWSGTASGWTKVAAADLLDSNDAWIGDINIDLSTGVIWLKKPGTGDSVGVGDRIYKGGTGTGWRQALLRGYLWSGGLAGLCCAGLGIVVSWASWSCAFCI